MTAQLEHANLTVPDPKATAAWMCDLFGWRIRWEGAAKDDGYSVHVGADDCYLALYAPSGAVERGPSTYATTGGLNHVGVQVDDLDAAEARVKAAGFVTTNHGDYKPGRRFYFNDSDGIEFEVVAYG